MSLPVRRRSGPGRRRSGPPGAQAQRPAWGENAVAELGIHTLVDALLPAGTLPPPFDINRIVIAEFQTPLGLPAHPCTRKFSSVHSATSLQI